MSSHSWKSNVKRHIKSTHPNEDPEKFEITKRLRKEKRKLSNFNSEMKVDQSEFVENGQQEVIRNDQPEVIENVPHPVEKKSRRSSQIEQNDTFSDLEQTLSLKTVVCPICEKNFACSNRSAKHSVRRHIKKVHNEDPDKFEIETIDPPKSREENSDFSNFEATPNTDQGNFKCPLCDEAFADVSKREKHIKSIHNIYIPNYLLIYISNPIL